MSSTKASSAKITIVGDTSPQLLKRTYLKGVAVGNQLDENREIRFQTIASSGGPSEQLIDPRKCCDDGDQGCGGQTAFFNARMYEENFNQSRTAEPLGKMRQQIEAKYRNSPYLRKWTPTWLKKLAIRLLNRLARIGS